MHRQERCLCVIRNSSKGRQHYQCSDCGRFFGETEGTPMYRLHTEAAEAAQALLIVKSWMMENSHFQF